MVTITRFFLGKVNNLKFYNEVNDKLKTKKKTDSAEFKKICNYVINLIVDEKPVAKIFLLYA